MSPRRRADTLSDRTLHPISYLSGGSALQLPTAAPPGSTVPQTPTPAVPSNALAGSRGLGVRGSGGPCPAGEGAQLKPHSELTAAGRHCVHVQVRACLGSLGRPCRGTVKPLRGILVIFLGPFHAGSDLAGS